MANKTLTIVLCQTREGNHTFPSLKSMVLDPLESDLAFCGSTSNATDDLILSNSKYIWNYEEPKDWALACDYISRNKSNWRDLCQFGDAFLGGSGYGDTKGSGLIIMYWREILRQSIKADIKEEYEWFVITRSDFKWIVRHPPIDSLKTNEIYVLDGEKYGGFSDRHIIFHRNVAEQIFGIASPIFHESEKLCKEFAIEEVTDLSPEGFLSKMLVRMNIQDHLRFIPYLGYTIRHANTDTRWSTGKYSRKLGYYVKYPAEYRDVYRARFAIKSQKDWQKILNHRNLLRYRFVQSMHLTDSPKNFRVRIARLICLGIDRFLQL